MVTQEIYISTSLKSQVGTEPLPLVFVSSVAAIRNDRAVATETLGPQSPDHPPAACPQHKCLQEELGQACPKLGPGGGVGGAEGVGTEDQDRNTPQREDAGTLPKSSNADFVNTRPQEKDWACFPRWLLSLLKPPE